jgi:deoxyribonuclease-4
VHTGSAVLPDRHDEAVRHLRAALTPLLNNLHEADPDLLLEHTAGGGRPVAATVDQLGDLLDELGPHPRLGVCFDTCHALAAGHDVTTPIGLTRTVDALAAAVGRDRIRLVHVNDSLDPVGSFRDRHAALGTGTIGLAPLQALATHPALAGVPLVIETPPDAVPHAEQIATLRALTDARVATDATAPRR